MKTLKQIREEHGAGEWGTPELVNKYKQSTPGQDVIPDKIATNELTGYPTTYDENSSPSSLGHMSYHAASLSAAALKAPSRTAHLKAMNAHQMAHSVAKGGAVEYHADKAREHMKAAKLMSESAAQTEETIHQYAHGQIVKHLDALKHHLTQAKNDKANAAWHYDQADYHSDRAIKHGATKKDLMTHVSESLKDTCWKGYEAIGMKDKNGRKVPNCVPKEMTENLSDYAAKAHSASELANKTGSAKHHELASKAHVAAHTAHKMAGQSHEADHHLDKAGQHAAMAARAHDHAMGMKEEMDYKEDEAEEVGMACRQLRKIASMSMIIESKLMNDSEALQAWMQSKIAIASDKIDEVFSNIVFSSPNDADRKYEEQEERSEEEEKS